MVVGDSLRRCLSVGSRKYFFEGKGFPGSERFLFLKDFFVRVVARTDESSVIYDRVAAELGVTDGYVIVIQELCIRGKRGPSFLIAKVRLEWLIEDFDDDGNSPGWIDGGIDDKGNSSEWPGNNFGSSSERLIEDSGSGSGSGSGLPLCPKGVATVSKGTRSKVRVTMGTIRRRRK